MEDFKSPIDADTVAAASASAVPVIGTEVPIINFAVFAATVSAAEFTAVCIPRIPTKIVEKSENVQRDIFLINSAADERAISGEIPEHKEIERYPPINGIIKNDDIIDTLSVAVRRSVLIETEVTAFPERDTSPAKMGINANIKMQILFIELADAETVEKTFVATIAPQAAVAAKIAV